MAVTASRGRHGVFAHDERDEVIGRSLRMYGEWAEEEIYLLSTLARSGDTVIDVGANVGTHSIALSRMVGSAGKVLSVEAQSEASALLSLNISLNGAENVRRIEGLVGRKRGVFLESPPTGGVKNIGAVTFRDSTSAEVESAENWPLRPVVMFDLDSLGVRECKLIKIDVEGMELDVLTGAAKLLKSCRPFVYFEQASDLNFLEIHILFKELKYRLFHHAANPFNSNNFRQVNENIFGGTREVNILAVPTEVYYMPPATLELTEIISPEHGLTASIVPEGWALPNGAYRDIPATNANIAIGIPPELTNNGSLADNFRDLSLRFQALHEDRVRAQEIMEHQAREIAVLRGVDPARTNSEL